MSMISVMLAVAFQAAQPVWPEGMANVSNVQVRFAAELKEAGDAILRVTGADAYRIELGGKFVGYGPARGPKGWFRIDEWPLKGSGRIEIVAQGNNCCNYYFAENKPFLQAEVVSGGKVIAATAAKGGGFAAELTERVRKTPRYSFQRAYAEAYQVGAAGKPVPLEVRPPVKYLERIAPYPSFAVNDRVRILSTADVSFGTRRHHDAKFDEMVGAVEVNNWDDLLRLRFANRDESARQESAPCRLKGGRSIRLDAGLDDCGFYGMTVEVRKPGKLILDFDEVLTDGEVNSSRMCCCNAVEWLFEKPGRYEVETFEPYVWRYANLSAFGGEFDVSGLHVRGYKNGQVGRAKFRCSDPALEKIFAAAVETYAQNAVDVFTDCPSRERAGWLCDSFFIGRVSKLLCGETEMERLFLQNYVLPETFDYLPDAALPMCYPSAHPNGNFIPNWVMWLVFEAEEYLARSGDRATIDALRPKFEAYVKYLGGFRNSDGLLEKLPKWVFVEWSQANKLVQDVNYPSNMTWAEVLDVMDRLYGKPELAAEAKRIRETVRKQSWTGRWFCDNAVRQSDGTLKLSGECTETCQYYAFFFKTATPETHPELWKTLVDDFGPKRKDTKLHPEIWPSNAFIGNYLRLELLSRAGLVKNILDETKGFFLYMADRTGTLWEFDSPFASCCHGFASHAVVYLYRDVLGVKSIDAANRKAVVEPPSGLDLDWCEGTIPVSPTETVTVTWRKGRKPTVRWQGADVSGPARCETFADDLAIQSAIDEAWKRGGGTVEVGTGVHHIRGLRLRSNVTLHLQRGAVLLASRNCADFDGWKDDALEPVPEPDPASPHQYFRNWFRAVIRIHGAVNASIVGEPGSVIDGANSFDPEGEEGYRGVHGITAIGATNCTFRGYTLRRAGNWAHHFRLGKGLRFENVTVEAGHDGIHLRACDRVDIVGCTFRTGDDSIAGFDNTDVHVRDCDISSACSAFRFGGRRVLIERCCVHGPCVHPFRGSLGRKQKEEGADGEGRHNMLSLFTYFSMKGYGIRQNAGEIVLRDIVVEGADRFLQYNYSGNEVWSSGVPLTDIRFENVTATGVKLPLCAYGSPETPLSLVFSSCRISFAEPQEAVIRGANFRKLCAEGTTVDGGEPILLRNYGPEAPISAKECEGFAPKEIRADEPFKVKAI